MVDAAANLGIDFGNRQTTIAGRHAICSNSAFDGNDVGTNANYDDAIAPAKTALLLGETATRIAHLYDRTGLQDAHVQRSYLGQGAESVRRPTADDIGLRPVRIANRLG